MSIKESMQTTRHADTEEEQEKLASLLTELAQHTASVLRHHAVRHAVCCDA